MPIDSDIPLRAQMPQFANPMDMAVKAMTIKQLGQQSRVADQTEAESQAMKQAFLKNTGADGQVDRKGVVKDFARSSPLKAMQMEKEFSDSDMQKLMDQTKAAKQLVWSIPTGPGVPMEQKQAAWAAVRQKGIELGLPNADKFPEQHQGDQYVQGMQMRTLSAEEQVTQKWKEKEYQQKDRELNLKHQEIAASKGGTAMKDTVQLLEGARGNPAAAQAERDLYAADKAKSLATLYGDPNNLNPAMVNLLVSEIGKIAQGGVPSMHELEGLTPNTLTGKMRKSWEQLSNSPTPANAGAFVKQYQDYAETLSKDAEKVIEDKYGRIVESRRKQLGEENYKTLQDQYLHRFKKEGEKKNSGKSEYHSMSDDELDRAYKAAGGK